MKANYNYKRMRHQMSLITAARKATAVLLVSTVKNCQQKEG